MVTVLEDRTLLSTLTVSNTNDSGDGSLRQAILDANTNAGVDAIVFSSLFNSRQTITLTGGQLTLTDTATTTITGPGANLLTVSGNGAGRVLQVTGGATAALLGLTITGGSSDLGGGVRNDGTATLTNCTVSGNSSPTVGGGLGNFDGTTTLIGCTILGNNSYLGGGLFISGGDVSLINCTVTGNTSTDTGGGFLVSYAGRMSLTNCTVTGNSTTLLDGYGGILLANGFATLRNTIVTGNTNGDISDGFQGTNNLIGAPLTLGPLSDYGGPTWTYALLPGSPAIGAGTAAGAPATDQRGLPRTGHVDIGAFQSQGVILTPTAGSTPQSAVVGTSFASPLAVTVTAANPVEPVDGGIISFASPASGPSATLSAATVVIAGGQAGVSATANTTTGSYTVTASAAGVSTAATFALNNTAVAAASIAVVSGSGQTATGATGFASPLVVVVKDAQGNPLPGVTVTFAAPNSGASATLIGSPAVTGADGRASVTATANTTTGSYTVTASAAGVSTAATFALNNTAVAAASIAVVSGSGQTATGATGFASPLVVVVKDAQGNPLPGVTVTFAAPNSGASATLIGSPAVTGADGRASVTATANTTTGSYAVTASAAGVATAATFTLTNTDTAGSLNLVTRPVAAVAGRPFINVVLATFTGPDPGASPSGFVAAILWGDGITTDSTTVTSDGQGGFQVLGTHTYDNPGTYTFSVQVTAGDGTTATATGTATVAAAARPLMLTTHRDVVDEFDGLTSLREAIDHANRHPGPDTITFDPAVFGKAPRTIKLIGGPLVLTDTATTTIIGPGAKLLTFLGDGKSGVFEVRGSAAISGLTIRGGSARGGGLLNDGTAALTDVVLRGNRALVGGGLANFGTMSLTRVVLRGNRALVGGGLFNAGKATLTDVVIRGNRARLGSGLFSTRRATFTWRS